MRLHFRPLFSKSGTRAQKAAVTAICDADQACAWLHEAAALNREDPLRRGSTLHFGSAGQLVVTGDMHGNLRNFDKLQKFCALERNPGRFVLLQELIHQELTRSDDVDLSIDLLLKAVAWKCAQPDNVFFLLSNHEMAQLRGQEITKGGRSVIRDFERGVAYRYGADADRVLQGVLDYIASLPLAARTASGVLMCHSLPDPLMLPTFDLSVFDRQLTDADLVPGGAAYAVCWGRFHSARDVEAFAQRLGVRVIIVGHTPQETGYNVIGNLIILASDHAHGAFIPIDLSKTPTAEDLELALRKYVSVE